MAVYRHRLCSEEHAKLPRHTAAVQQRRRSSPHYALVAFECLHAA
jgi:hypothetical protein